MSESEIIPRKFSHRSAFVNFERKAYMGDMGKISDFHVSPTRIINGAPLPGAIELLVEPDRCMYPTDRPVERHRCVTYDCVLFLRDVSGPPLCVMTTVTLTGRKEKWKRDEIVN